MLRNRPVGAALRNNPFAPYVPCHRVVASNMTLGGFLGEWGTENKEGSQCSRKAEMLAKEGVLFTQEGRLRDGKQALWVA